MNGSFKEQNSYYFVSRIPLLSLRFKTCLALSNWENQNNE
jgi:hypothetical protein